MNFGREIFFNHESYELRESYKLSMLKTEVSSPLDAKRVYKGLRGLPLV